MDFLKKYFEFDKLGTNFRTETIAGLTTFVSMAYILFVNASILSLDGIEGVIGMNAGAVFTATAIAAAIGTFIMGIYAKYPIALAPGMGVNSFFAFTVVYAMGIPWQTALAGTFVSGIIFLIIALSGLREIVIDAIPRDLKLAISSGIGLFVTFIGLRTSGLIVASGNATLIELGSLTEPSVLITIFGVVAVVILLMLNVKGAIFIGMILTAIVGVITTHIAPPTAIVGAVPSLAPTFGVAFGSLGEVFNAQMLIVVVTFLFMDFFDTAGTLIAVTEQAGLGDKDGKLPRAKKALVADATATVFGSVLGTSTVTSFIESTAGIAAGGKSGFSAVITGLAFLLAMFFSPLLGVITSEVTAPALIVVGIFMASSLKNIDWDKLEIAVPAFFAVVLMPFTNSIIIGLTVSMIFYPITMGFKGRIREINPVLYILTILSIIYLVFGMSH